MAQQTVAVTSEKLVLASTSAVSLNQRFTTILKKQVVPVDVQDNMLQVQAVNRVVGNRGLARRLEARVVEAETFKLRLGKGLFRLDRPIRSLTQQGTRSWGFAVRRRRWMYKRGFRVPGNIRWGFFRGGSSSRGMNPMHARGMLPKQRFHQGLQVSQQNSPGGLVRRGAKVGLRGRGRGNSVGQRGRRGFQGRGRGGPRKIPTKEELDKQLDDYMSMTKRRLDADLDAYMAMAGSDYME